MITRSQASQVHCSICLSLVSDTLGRIQCSHVYCFKCIKDWSLVKHACPLCKQRISQIHMLKVGNFKEETRKLKGIEPETLPIDQDSL